LPSPLREDFVDRQKAAAERGGGASRVLVHGDLTGENVMVREDGSLCILDWADALPAAETYEWPPLVFELFRCDPELVGFFCEEDPQGFAAKLVDALTLHDFGADILLAWQEREGLVIDSLEELEEWLKKECLYG
jgi:serine/threonine-protein kinase RIO1